MNVFLIVLLVAAWLGANAFTVMFVHGAALLQRREREALAAQRGPVDGYPERRAA